MSKVETRERRLDIVEFIAFAQALGAKPSTLMDALQKAVGEPLVF